MKFDYSEEQRLVADSVRRFVAQDYTFEARKAIVASKDGSIAALLGASPGASTAPSIMLNLIKKVFPDRLATPAWQAKIREIVPSYGTALNEDRDLLAHEWAATAETLQLAMAPPAVSSPATTEAPRPEATRVSPNRHPDLAL